MEFLNPDAASSNAYFKPANPIEDELADMVNRPLYKLLKQLPKGGNLHMHENQMLDRKKLLQIIQNAPEYDFLYICDPNKPQCLTSVCNCSSYFLSYFPNGAVDGWVKVDGSNWTIGNQQFISLIFKITIKPT